MSTIVVGDLHGDVNIANDILDRFWVQSEHIIFVGDYFDSFEFSREDQLSLINNLISAQKRDPDKIVLMAGNHELSYLYPGMRCSGYSMAFQSQLDHTVDLKAYLRDNLKSFVFVNDWLITHAGVSLEWIPHNYREMDILDFLALAEKSENQMMFQIGEARGGFDLCGGPFWCDFWKEFKSIPNVKQVFGHTSWRPEKLDLDNVGILKLENNYNIDCLRHHREVLKINSDSSVEIVEF